MNTELSEYTVWNLEFIWKFKDVSNFNAMGFRLDNVLKKISVLGFHRRAAKKF